MRNVAIELVNSATADQEKQPSAAPPLHCSMTPTRVAMASLPLFAERGSQIRSAEMATREYRALASSGFPNARGQSSGACGPEVCDGDWGPTPANPTCDARLWTTPTAAFTCPA